MEKGQQKQSVIKSAVKMSMGTFSSRVLGLVRDALISAFFTRTVTDAFLVAFRLPNFFRRILGEGSLNVSFIPVFIEQLSSGEPDSILRKQRAMRLANSVFTLLLGLSSCLSVLGIVFMDQLMALLVGTDQFAGIAGKLELTTLFARIMFVYLFLVSTYAYLMAIANSLRAFFVPAVAPAFFNLCVILSALLPNMNVPGLWLAWGVVVGGIVQLTMVAYQLLKLGALPRLTLNIRVPGLGTVLKNMVPGLIGLGILQIISLINIAFAAQLPEGAHTYLYYGDRLLELPQSLLAISLGTALLPSLSEMLAYGKKDEMLLTAAHYMRLLLYLALPSCVGLYILAEPIIDVLFSRGEFKPADIIATAGVLQIYSFLLLASSFTKVIVPSFFAIKDTKTPAIVSLVVVLVHLVLAPILMALWGLKGLALATTLSGFLNMILLLILYGRIVGELYLKRLFGSAIKMLPGLIVLGIAATILQAGSQHIVETLQFQGMALQITKALALGLVISVCGGLYLIASHVFKVEEAQFLHEAFLRRLRRRSKV